jgi:transcription elongation GreA/GreB family factor
MPEKNSYKPIRFIPVNGLYEKNRTNPTEAKYVVDILFDKIRPYDNGEYPSIGIATFNIDQRNKILELIQDECYMDDSKREKNEKLRASGLFVKNLENIQGDERDIMILSTTFGLNSSGKFRQNFGPINRSKGYKLFNVLITRAKRKLILCTSIPQEYYERYREEIPVKGNTGKAIFYAYLAYAASIERGDEETRQNILDLIREQCEAESLVKPEKFVESPFEQEVYDYLIDYIDEDRIEIQYAFGGFRIDFVIKSKHDERPIIAIECDGAQYHDSEEAYAHDMYRQKIIEQEGGFHFYRIWSTNWWPDPEKEVRKLVDFIEAKDSEGSEKEIVEHYRDEIIDESFNTLETVSVNNTFKEKQATAEKSVVTSDSDVQIKNIHDGSKMTIRFTDLKSKVDLKSRDRKIVHEDSPLAKALYNRAVGEKFKINGIEVYYEILDIEN